MAQELKAIQVSNFLEMALKSVEEGVEDLHNKGVGVRFDKDYCNSIVEALKLKDRFKGFSESEIKMCLSPLFKALILNTIARELQIIVE